MLEPISIMKLVDSQVIAFCCFEVESLADSCSN